MRIWSILLIKSRLKMVYTSKQKSLFIFYGLSALVDCWSLAFIRRIIYIFLNVSPFDCTAFAVSGKVGIP